MIKRLDISGPLAAALAVLMSVGLLTRSEDIAQGITRGLIISGQVLIPALFPFMALCSYIILTDAARILSIPLRPLTKYVFRLPPEHGTVVLMSFVGGYPAGGRMISGLLEQGRVDTHTAERMLGFCYGPSPAFLITAVGAGMLFDRRAGMILFCAQVISAVLVGFILSLKAPWPSGKSSGPKMKGGAGAFVSAVTSASATMFNLCAFAVFFSGLLYLIKGSGAAEWLGSLFHAEPDFALTLIAGFLEVTSGSAYASLLGGARAILLISFFCSWGGLSSVFQIISFFGKTKLRLKIFFMSRILHCFLAAAISLILYRFFSADTPVMFSGVQPLMMQNSRSWLSALCLIAMIVMLTMKPRRLDR